MLIPIAGVKEILKLPFSFVIFLLSMMLLIGADLVFGAFAMQMRIIIIVYVVLLVYTRTEPEFMKTAKKPVSLAPALPAFFIMFIISLMATLFISGTVFGGVIAASTVETSMGIALTLGFGFSLAVVKVYIEEEVFRARMMVRFGVLGQAILFGLFHFAILAATLGFTVGLIFPILWLIGLGVVWAVIYMRFGLPGATGSHLGYNTVALGLAPLIFGGIIV